MPLQLRMFKLSPSVGKLFSQRCKSDTVIQIFLVDETTL